MDGYAGNYMHMLAGIIDKYRYIFSDSRVDLFLSRISIFENVKKGGKGRKYDHWVHFQCHIGNP